MKGEKMIRKVLRDLYQHKYTYILKALLLQLFLTTIGIYILSELFSLILFLGNQVQLNKDNLADFFLNPLTLLGFILYFFAVALLVYMEFSILVEIIRQKDSPIRVTIKRSLFKIKPFLRSISGFHLFAFIGYLILTVPVVQYVMASSLVEKLYIPKFITDELMKSSPTRYIMMAMGILVFYLNIRFIYTLPLTVIKEAPFLSNMKESWQLTKKKTFTILWQLAVIESVILVTLFSIALLIIMGLNYIDSSEKHLILQTIFLSFSWGVLYSASLLSKLSSISYLLSSIHEDKSSYLLSVQKARKKKSLLALMTLVTAMGLVTMAWNWERFSGVAFNKNIKTIAHRGYVSKGVENSIEALEGAAKQGVDYVEMDILLTKDHHFVVIHDNNLSRLAGVDKNVSDLKASEVVGLAIHQDGYQSTISSFEDYVARSKELGVKLLVELKPHGSEPDNYAQLFVDKMKELGVEKDYQAMSLDLSVMEKIEQLAPEIQTGYVIPLQIGNFDKNKVDFWVIEDFSYRERLALEAKYLKKSLYVWTVNDEDQIEKYLNSSVNGMITDYPNLVKEAKKSLEENDSYMMRFLSLLS